MYHIKLSSPLVLTISENSLLMGLSPWPLLGNILIRNCSHNYILSTSTWKKWLWVSFPWLWKVQDNELKWRKVCFVSCVQEVLVYGDLDSIEHNGSGTQQRRPVPFILKSKRSSMWMGQGCDLGNDLISSHWALLLKDAIASYCLSDWGSRFLKMTS